MPRTNSHDQNFKNLILDYPRQALAFFAPTEAADIDDSASITPLRQEQLKQRLSDRFHELDVPLLAEWPDGRREALLFVLEEESDPARFSIHRLVHYCTDLAELCQTERMVPVVIFLRGDRRIPERLELGSERHTYLSFRYLRCLLAETPAEDHLSSDNLVARLNLPNMQWPAERKVEIYAQAIRGLLQLEPDPEKQLKYIDFIDIYTALDENERRIYQDRYPQEDQGMTRLTERLLEQGKQQGIHQGIEQGLEQGMQRGELTVLSRLLIRRFGPLAPEVEQRLQQAGLEELERWAENVLEAKTLDEVFGTPLPVFGTIPT
ncbi:DUF4351 domain-containing protein [Pseudomonas lopnurensis]|uniref:DUF4351 domain-containing protein n=1 Tax=Pseudomonas lopnurensis TaxID=1477517 RepID=UPI00187AA537|nr:DUF4351 domain-containing protein [Pseudomonas lopnurensis]MBE7374219.1 DUF4351 domain-containing protein [Pseudomonas lopnurensis]